MELWRDSAVRLAAGFASGEFTPVDATHPWAAAWPQLRRSGVRG